MPRKPRPPLTRKDRVIQWLRMNPGYHRPMTIAAALGEPTQPIAADCRKLMEQGILDRTLDSTGRRGTYAVKETVSA